MDDELRLRIKILVRMAYALVIGVVGLVILGSVSWKILLGVILVMWADNIFQEKE